MDIQWSLVLFTALTGMGGWLFFFICLSVFVRKTDKGAFAGTATALALTVVGGLASVTHLSHPDRMLGALQHPTSGIFTEALLVGLLAIVMIAFLVMLRRGIDGGALPRRRRGSRRPPARTSSRPWTPRRSGRAVQSPLPSPRLRPGPPGTPSCCRSATWARRRHRARPPTSCSSPRRRPTRMLAASTA